MVKFVVFNVLLVGSCGYAFLRGGAPERIAAAIFAIGTALTVVAASAYANRFGSVEIGILVVDATCLVAFLALALCAQRFWPLWVTGLQIIGTAGHVVKLANPDVIPWAYGFVLAWGAYPMLLLIAIGTWRHRCRLAEFGVDRSWSISSGRSEPPRGPTI